MSHELGTLVIATGQCGFGPENVLHTGAMPGGQRRIHRQVGVHEIQQLTQSPQPVPVQAKHRGRTKGHSSLEDFRTGMVRDHTQMLQSLVVVCPHPGNVIVFGKGHKHGVFATRTGQFQVLCVLAVQQFAEEIRDTKKVALISFTEKVVGHQNKEDRIPLQNILRTSVYQFFKQFCNISFLVVVEILCGHRQ